MMFIEIASVDLTTTEAQHLARLEATIEAGLQTFVDVGRALLEIRDERLYRQSFGTFEDYCRDRWGMSRIHAHRMIEAANVTNNLLPIGNILPATESQARPLASLEPEQQREAWQRAVDTAPNGKVTAAHVQSIVNGFRTPAHVTVEDDLGHVETVQRPERKQPMGAEYASIVGQPDLTLARSPRISIINADSQRLGDLVAQPAHLVVTSPPYNVGIEYDQHDDNLVDYVPMLCAVWRECYRVMVDGARIAVVVPFGVGRNPYVPFDCQIMQTLTDVGFAIRGRIIWDKNTTGNRTSWGSYRMSSSPAIRDTTECIIVAHKGSDSLEIPAEVKRRDEKGTYTEWLQDGDYFMGLAQDHWVIAPESAQRVKHPAPFPVELVERLIHFYAFPGAHVLDPFGGSGTTGIAALRWGCNATLVELSTDYCQLAKDRIDAERII